MSIPDQWLNDANLLPPPLRALLEAELATGNSIIDVGHSHPAAPVGVYFKLAGPVTTRPRKTDGELKFYERGSSLFNGEFTDAKGYCYILEAPLPPPPYPDMDAIREAANKPRPKPEPPTGDTPHDRFIRSMDIDYEKWHDGIGYDLDALAESTGEERDALTQLLLRRQPLTWREVEALVQLDTAVTRDYLRKAMSGRGTEAEARAAILRMAPDLVNQDTRLASVVNALESSVIYGGLSQTLDLVEKYHPPQVIDALLKGVVRREGDVACHFSAMLMFLHGKADSAFDWDQRPYFLKFNTEDQDERWTMFVDLCGKIGVDPNRYRVGRRRSS